MNTCQYQYSISKRAVTNGKLATHSGEKPYWHIPRKSFQSMALPVLPDTLPEIHSGTKNHLCSTALCMWAPTHKMPKVPQLTLTQVILPDYLRMAQIPTAHNTSVQYDVL